MPRFLDKLIRWVRFGYYWILDYAYIVRVQLTGLILRDNASRYLQPHPSQHSTPILLIPGIYERWDVMKPIAVLLFEAGYSVHIIEGIGYNRGTIEDMAQKIDEYVTSNNLENCLIVAHSKGGLIGKYLMMIAGSDRRFQGMVALNTPFAGSKYAYLFPQKSLRVFTPTSPTLMALASNKSVNAKIVSLYGIFDPHIPGENHLVGARNIRLNVYGHFSPIKSSAVHQAILVQLSYLETS